MHLCLQEYIFIIAIFKGNKYLCLDGVQSDGTSAKEMDGINDGNFKLHGTIADKNMFVTGKLHINGRVRETMDSQHNGETCAVVDEQSRDETTISEYMAQCNYK